MALVRNSKKRSGISSDEKEDKQLYVALDIGSSKLRLVAGYIEKNKTIKIKGLLEIKSAGVSNGSVSDIDLLSSRISQLMHDFQEKYGIAIYDIITGVPGHVVCAENQRGSATITSGTVTEADRNYAIENAKARVKNIDLSEYELIHSNPQNYIIENSDSITNPIGQFAKSLDVNVHIIGCASNQLRNIELVIKKTNPNINNTRVIYNGNAAVSATVSESEKEIGVIALDIGAETLSVTVYEGNKQLISFGIKDGANYITTCIAKSLGIPTKYAELIKLQYGYAYPDELPPEIASQVIKYRYDSADDMQGEEGFAFELGYLSKTIHECLLNMFDLVFERINKIGQQSLDHLDIGGGFVLTGGGAKIKGIEKVLRKEIEKYANLNQGNEFVRCSSKVRVGRPGGIQFCEGSCDPNFAKDPDKAVAIGLLRSGCFENIDLYSNKTQKGEPKSGVGKAWVGVKNWFKREF